MSPARDLRSGQGGDDASDLLSGSGRYQDEWHDFAATSAAIAAVLSDLELDVTVVPTTPERLRAVVGADLLVVNAC